MKSIPVTLVLLLLAVGIGAAKSHPGHYVSLRPADSSSLVSSATIAGVMGVQIRYQWRDLESGAQGGVYDFSKIHADLDKLSRAQRYLVAFIEDKTFDGTDPLPGYLSPYRIYSNSAGGYIAQRWHPFVVERMKALMAEMGRHFDTASCFEGVAFQETSIGLNDSQKVATQYTPEAYRDALIQVLTGAQIAFPNSKVFWYMNFLAGNNAYLGEIAEAIAPYGVAMGGPDILPDNASLQRIPYPYYEQFAGRMPLFCSAQYDSYCHPHNYDSSLSYTFLNRTRYGYTTKYWTLGEICDFAVRELHTTYIFWNKKTWHSPDDSYSFNEAIPVFTAHPLKNQESQAAPSRLGGPVLTASPNPFNAAGTFRLFLPSDGTVRLSVYGADGRFIRHLARGAIEAGTHAFNWNGDDARGRKVPAGLYLCRLTADNGQRTCKTLLTR